MSKRVLEIEITDRRWRRIPRLHARLEQAARATLAQLPKYVQFPCTITILLTDDAEIRRLNRDFRGIHKATNVLSFPQFSDIRKLTTKGKKRGQTPIGDIAFGYQYIVAEAKKEHKILINHAIHLLIHGILHLFGYDHRLGADAMRMERLEIRVMACLGLPNPYQPKE